MDNESKKLKELGYKINGLKKRGKKKVEWNLTSTEREYLEKLLGKEKLVPIIYQITTQSIANFRSIKSSIVREVYFAYKAGKKTIGRSLKKQEMKDLDKYEIKYSPIKFIIYLN